MAYVSGQQLSLNKTECTGTTYNGNEVHCHFFTLNLLSSYLLDFPISLPITFLLEVTILSSTTLQIIQMI